MGSIKQGLKNGSAWMYKNVIIGCLIVVIIISSSYSYFNYNNLNNDYNLVIEKQDRLFLNSVMSFNQEKFLTYLELIVEEEEFSHITDAILEAERWKNDVYNMILLADIEPLTTENKQMSNNDIYSSIKQKELVSNAVFPLHFKNFFEVMDYYYELEQLEELEYESMYKILDELKKFNDVIVVEQQRVSNPDIQTKAIKNEFLRKAEESIININKIQDRYFDLLNEITGTNELVPKPS